MSDVNSFTFTGRLTRDPETFGDSNQFVKYDVANNTGFGKYEKTQFFNCKVFNSRDAEFATKNFKKGSHVQITGAVEDDSYENKEGVKIRRFAITVIMNGFANGGGSQSEDAVPAGTGESALY